MTESIPKFQSSVDRPVLLRMRPDLVVVKQRVSGKIRFFIKDPIAQAHHQLWEEEFELLKMLDGKVTLQTIKERFESRFRPARLDLRLLERLHAHFFRSGLVHSNHPGQGLVLWERHLAEKEYSPLQWLFRLLSLRFRGFNPNTLLTRIDRSIGWLLSPAALIAILLVSLATLVFILTHWTEAIRKTPDWQEALAWQNVLGTVAIFMATKVAHEFGHGLACKHMGGDCNEMGLMLFAFTPFLYCDVSDSWMISSKWRRAFVAAAGVFSEIVIATLAAWVWWFSHPGWIHEVAFNTMLLGSLGSLLINANPLTRFDGYFVLSDLLEIPNLWSRSKWALQNGVRHFFFRNAQEIQWSSSSSQNSFLVVYGLASTLYRWMMMILVLTFLYSLFHLWRLEIVGATLVTLTLASGFTRNVLSTRSFMKSWGHWSFLRKGRTALVLVSILSLLGVFFFVPLPSTVTVDVTLEYADATAVVAIVSGELKEAIQQGSFVKKGDPIATLSSPSLELELFEREGELAKLRARLSGLEARRNRDPSVSTLIPATEESIDGISQEVARLEAEKDQLVLRSPIDGVVLDAEREATTTSVDGVEGWNGSPLERKNLGCFIQRGTKLCSVGNRERLRAIASIDQSQVELISPGNKVAVSSKELPGTVLGGVVSEVGQSPASSRGHGRSGGGNLEGGASKSDPNGKVTPLYMIGIDLETGGGKLSHRSRGLARIQMTSQTLAVRLIRFFYSTFL